MRVLESASLDVSKLNPMQQYWAYNALDCCITLEVFEKLAPKIPEAGFAYDMSRTMQGPAFTLMNRGVRLDSNRVLSLLAELREERARCEQTFFRLTTEGLGLEPYYDAKHKKHFGINPNSPQQLQALFYEHLAIPAIKNFNRQTKEETITTNREALEKLQKLPKAKPFCDLILAIRDCDKQTQVLLASQGSNRMHCSYQVAGTLSGRWSSNESAFGGGTNLQNISDEMRRIFVPDPGLKFAQFDLEQAESKLVAYLALLWGDNYLRACLSSDLHTTTTMLVWPDRFPAGNNEPRKIAEQPFYRHFSYRDMAKRGGHGSNYGGSPAVLSMHLKIPREGAESFQHAYFKAFPEIRHWQNSVRLALAKDRSITTPLGRRCFFPGRPWDNDTVKSAIAYSPQSSIGDILNLGFYNVWKNLDSFVCDAGPIQLLTQVHDSIKFQYRPEDESWLIPKVTELLKVPVTIHGRECIINTEAAVGWNWGKFHSKENPHGLMKWKGSDTRDAPAPTSFLDRKLHIAGK